MPVLVTSMFDEDPIKHERASMETQFSDYRLFKVTLFRRGGPIWPKFELVPDFMPILVICKFEKDLMKNNRKGGDIVFPIISQWALSVAMETRVLVHLRRLCSTQVMLNIKFDQHWPTGNRDIQKCGRRRRTADHWYSVS